MINPDYIPSVNDPLNGASIELIADAFKRRRKNFPDEPNEMTLALILLHIGSRFTPLECANKEWRGFKKDLSVLYSINPEKNWPACPNGHALSQGQGIVLGWVLEPKE